MEIIKIIWSLWVEYNLTGLIIALLIFYLGGSYLSKQLIKWAIGSITGKNLFFKFLSIFSISYIIPFILQMIALSNGTPVDTEKLQEIFSLKETSFIGIVIALFMFSYTYKKEKEKFDLKIKELKIRLNKRRKQRQEQKKRKREDKRRKKDAQKNRKKS